MVFGRLHLLPIALEFLTAFPDVDLRLMLSDSTLSLLDDNIDLAVRIGILPDSSLIATRIGLIRHVVCASPAYFSARGGRSPRPTSAVTTTSPSTTWRHRASGLSPRAGPRSPWVRSRLVVNTAEAAIDAAIAGVGLTRVLSYQVAQAIRAGTLTLALEAFEPAPWPVSLLYAGQGLLPLKLRAFVDFAAPRLKARLA